MISIQLYEVLLSAVKINVNLKGDLFPSFLDSGPSLTDDMNHVDK